MKNYKLKKLIVLKVINKLKNLHLWKKINNFLSKEAYFFSKKIIIMLIYNKLKVFLRNLKEIIRKRIINLKNRIRKKWIIWN